MAALIERDEASPRKWTADALARELGVTDAIRTALCLTMIGAIDFNKERRAQRQKSKKKDNSTAWRRQRGMVPREEYLAAHAESRTKPWIALGKSRAKYYRDKAREKPDETSPNRAKREEVLLYTEESHQTSPPIPAVDERGPPEAVPRLAPCLAEDVLEGDIIPAVGVAFSAPPPLSHTQRGIERAIWRQQQEGLR